LCVATSSSPRLRLAHWNFEFIGRVIIEFVRRVRPVVERVRAKDQNLGDQLRRALTSVPLNVQEGSYSQGRNVKARFHDALGSAAEVRACLDVSEALGYVDKVDDELRDSLDHIIATLHRLTQR
jgi:four helix bundle protein